MLCALLIVYNVFGIFSINVNGSASLIMSSVFCFLFFVFFALAMNKGWSKFGWLVVED